MTVKNNYYNFSRNKQAKRALNPQMMSTAPPTSWPTPGPFTQISGNYYQLPGNTAYSFPDGFVIPSGITAYLNPGAVIYVENNGIIDNYGTLVIVFVNGEQAGLGGVVSGNTLNPITCSVTFAGSTPDYSVLPVPDIQC